MAVLRNIARVRTATVGAGAVTLGAAVPGYKTFVQAGCVHGEVLTYGIHDFDALGNLIASEVGRGTYNAVFGTLARTTVLASTNADAALNLSGNAHVFITAIAEDFDHTSGSILNVGVNTHAQIDLHLASVANPHATTAAQVGAPALVNPSVVGNFVSFSNLTGAQQDSGVSAASFQPVDATLTMLSALADAAGWLHNNGAGVLAWSTPTAADVGAEPTLVKGNLTATSPLAFDNTRQVIGGAAQVKLGVSVADRYLYSTNTDIWAEGTITVAGRAILDDADAAAQRTTLGLVAGGAGDIWVEKAGDTMTGQLIITPAADTQNIILNKPATADFIQCKSGATVQAGVDNRGIIYSHGGIDSDSFYAGGAGNPAAAGAVRSIGIGKNVLAALTSGDNNVGIGYDCLTLVTANASNMAIGYRALRVCTGTGNVAVGADTLRTSGAVNYNMALGGGAMESVAGSFNVAIGYSTLQAGNQNNVVIGHQAGITVTGSGNILLGFNAAYNQVGISNVLLIDNVRRASAAVELTNSIIYGVMGATPGVQTLRLNAVVTDAVNTTTTNAPLIVHDFNAYVSTAGTGFSNGGGVGVTFTGETATDGTSQLMAQVAAIWTDSTNLTRKAYLSLSAYDTAIREGLRINATGAAATLTFLGHAYAQADSRKVYWGAGDDMSIYYNGADGYIKVDEVAASDLHITCGTAKTLVLDTPVYMDMQWRISSGRVGAANFPDWVTLTTNTGEYAFDVDDYIDLGAEELPHNWVEGGIVDFHLHIALVAANSTGSNRFAKFSVYPAYSKTGVVWTEAAALTQELTIPTGSAANLVFYLDMGDLNLAGYGVGSYLKVRVKRIAATGGTEYASHIFIHQVGGHIKVDTLGSRSETTK